MEVDINFFQIQIKQPKTISFKTMVVAPLTLSAWYLSKLNTGVYTLGLTFIVLIILRSNQFQNKLSRVVVVGWVVGLTETKANSSFKLSFRFLYSN
jgi:hypothetical protein